MIINIRKTIDYSLMTLFMGVSGVPYISDPKVNVLLFILLSATFFYRKRNFNAYFLLFLAILLIITLLQGLKFEFISLITTIGLFTLVLNAYFMVKILQDKFIDYFITVMYFISIISLVFVITFLILPALGHFVLYNIVPLFSVFNIAGTIHKTVLVYNLSHIESFRNSGPFWEPAAFAGYLLIAFMFNFLKGNRQYNKKSLILLITLLTTFSTTGFLALFIFLFFNYYDEFKNFLFKVVTVIILITVAIISYFSLDFLGKKIEQQIELETSKAVLTGKARSTGRFITIIRDFQVFEGHEWVGRGGHSYTRFGITPGQKIPIRSVGLTDVIVKYGIFFFIIMLTLLYKSISSYINSMFFIKANYLIIIGTIIPILTLLFSEIYFGYTFYWSLLFLLFVYKKKNEGSNI